MRCVDGARTGRTFRRRAGPFFDYGIPDTGKPGQPGFAPAPFLDNNPASAAAVSAILASRQNAGLLLAIKVREPLTDPSAVAVFNNFRVQYVFADYEDAARVGRTRAIADQVAASSKSSGRVRRQLQLLSERGRRPDPASQPVRQRGTQFHL